MKFPFSSDTSHPAVDAAILQQLLAGDYRAVARLITLAENGSPAATAYLRALYPHTGRSVNIGITGSPGSGKSTLVDRLATHDRNRGKKVGIIAVDPTSPYSGGAILGDRIRMQSRSVDPHTFIRSMATRGHLGGLARTTTDALLILDAAGFETIFIETVGVGQDEVEVARTATITLVLLVPGMGDDIQVMKAGIMEVGDIFVVNKADHPGVDRIDAELQSLLALSSRPDGWKPRVVKTIASQGQGVEECVLAIEDYLGFLRSSPLQKTRNLQVYEERVLELARRYVTRDILGRKASVDLLKTLGREVADRLRDPYSAAEELLRASGIRTNTPEE